MVASMGQKHSHESPSANGEIVKELVEIYTMKYNLMAAVSHI